MQQKIESNLNDQKQRHVEKLRNWEDGKMGSWEVEKKHCRRKYSKVQKSEVGERSSRMRSGPGAALEVRRGGSNSTNHTHEEMLGARRESM